MTSWRKELKRVVSVGTIVGRIWGRKWDENRRDGEKVLLAEYIKFGISEDEICMKKVSVGEISLHMMQYKK